MDLNSVEYPGMTVVVPSVSWASRLARFDHQIFGRDSWPEAVWHDELQATGRTYLVVSAPPSAIQSLGEIVAVGGVLHGDDAEILTLAVNARFRRRHIGQKILTKLLEIAREHGAQRAFLEVRKADSGVQKMYQDAGFVPIATRKKYYHDDDAVVMMRQW